MLFLSVETFSTLNSCVWQSIGLFIGGSRLQSLNFRLSIWVSLIKWALQTAPGSTTSSACFGTPSVIHILHNNDGDGCMIPECQPKQPSVCILGHASRCPNTETRKMSKESGLQDRKHHLHRVIAYSVHSYLNYLIRQQQQHHWNQTPERRGYLLTSFEYQILCSYQSFHLTLRCKTTRTK